MDKDAGQAYVEDVEQIDAFGISINSFVKLTEMNLAVIQKDIFKEIQIMQKLCDSCTQRLEKLQEQWANADDDDDDLKSELLMEINQCRLKLAHLTKCLREATQNMKEIDIITFEFNNKTKFLYFQAIKFLSAKFALLLSYHSVSLDSNNCEPDISSALPISNVNDLDAQKLKTNIIDIALPNNYVWVVFSDIDLAKELKDVQLDSQFKKVSYQTMVDGANHFMNNILPIIKQDRTKATSEYFGKTDQIDGLSYEFGNQRAFDAFLGGSNSDPVYLTRGLGEKLFMVTNGKHRIKVANDLGWAGIPAVICDQNV